jgi:hypothetical protein
MLLHTKQTRPDLHAASPLKAELHILRSEKSTGPIFVKTRYVSARFTPPSPPSGAGAQKRKTKQTPETDAAQQRSRRRARQCREFELI